MLLFQRHETRALAGLKGPRGAQWLAEQGIALPPEPNTWTEYGDPALLVARLGASEFFLVAAGAAAGGAAVLQRISSAVQAGIEGVYPVLREDAAFVLSGDGASDVLAQVCSVNFAALELAARPVIMTLLIGVSVLIVPQAAAGEVRYRLWCDPTFGSYLDAAVGTVVIDCGGSHGEMPA